jgi:F-type H+-transporting ATPase subunit delta
VSSGLHLPQSALRYASALLELVGESKATDAVANDITQLIALIDESKDLRTFLASPLNRVEDQVKTMAAIAKKAGAHKLTTHFLQLVASNRRLSELPAILQAFKRLHAEKQGLATAEVVVASPLSAAQKKALTESIAKATGKTIELSITEDKSILGGLTIKVGSRMLDASLKTKLNSLNRLLREVA